MSGCHDTRLAQPVHGEETRVQPPLVHHLHQVPRHVIRQVGRHLEYSAVQNSTVQYSTEQYSTVQYSTVRIVHEDITS